MTQILPSGVVPTGNSDLVFDTITGDYIELSSGMVLSAEELPESPKKSAKIYKPQILNFDQWCDVLSYHAFLGKQWTDNQVWPKNEPNPDVIIGQTEPWTLKHHELVSNGEIEFFLPKDEYAGGQPHLTVSRTPNTVEIEHGIGKDQYSDPDLLDIDIQRHSSEVPPAEFFEAIQILASYIKKNPTANHWKWLPTMISFIAEHISLVDASGEISIPDLLSAFKAKSSEVQELLHLLKVSNDSNESLRKKLKHLRTLMYGHSKHK
jgi:hypothetical protein